MDTFERDLRQGRPLLTEAQFPELLESFDGYLELAGRSPVTRGTYRYELTRFWCDYAFSRGDVLGQDTHSINAYLLGLPSQGEKRRSAIRSLRAFYKWLTKQDWFLSDPTEDLKEPKVTRASAPDIPREELRKILRAAFRWPRYEGPYLLPGFDRRRGWSILLAIETGARLQSLANVRREDIHLDDPKGAYVYFRVAKGNKPYELALTRPAAMACKNLLRLGHDPILGVGGAQFRHWLQQATTEAKVDRRVYPHLLRHYFSHRVAEKAVKAGRLEVWRQSLNHADLSQFPRYNNEARRAFTEVMEGGRG
jgi:site-specific recombinase XerD